MSSNTGCRFLACGGLSTRSGVLKRDGLDGGDGTLMRSFHHQWLSSADRRPERAWQQRWPRPRQANDTHQEPVQSGGNVNLGNIHNHTY